MTRRLRIHVPGGFYHVTLRGNHRQPIFGVPADRALLNAIVGRSLRAYSARLHAYCWMTNHLHFFLQIGDLPLGGLMRDIASNYARAYQAKLVTSGHLFERRYHAKLVDIDVYLFALLRYIHLNPVKDRLVPDAASYPWSSHRAYAGLVAPEPWLEIDFCLAVFAQERREAQAAYRRFVDQSDPMRDDEELNGSRDVLGDDKFMANLSKRGVTSSARQTLAELVTEGCERFGVPLATLQSVCRDPQSVRARGWIACQAKERRVATLSDVARLLGRDRATLRYSMRVQAERK